MSNKVILRHDGAQFSVKFPAYTPACSVPRSAGFKFNGVSWATSDVTAVARILEIGPSSEYEFEVTAEAKTAFDTLRERHAAASALAITSVAASYATDADVEIPAPEGLSYLPYQRAGIAYALVRESVLIADDMGLGKTIQAIGVVNADANARRVLVVSPAGLKLNWVGELLKWDVKGLTVAVAKSAKKLPDADVVIVNFELVAKLRPKIDAIDWDVLIVDEAHYVKNPKAQRTIAILGGGKAGVQPIKARRRVFLTGTPIVNRPSELWPLVKSLDPIGLGAMGWWDFARRYCGGHNTQFGFVADGATNLDELQMRLRGSIMVRRLKKDVLKDLPAKRRQLLPIEANNEIKRIIKSMETTEAETNKRLADLRKMAKSASAGSETYKAISAQIGNVATVAFEQMSAHRHELAVAKAPLVVEHVREILEAEDAIVIAVYHKEVVRILSEALHDLGVHLITGDESFQQRQDAKDRFQAGEGRVVIGTIGAMAEGWTLTRASTMVFGELDWTPGKVTQTEDRIHRLGQKNSVLIQHLVVDGTLDATFVRKLVEKQEVITAAVDGGADENKTALAAELFGVSDLIDIDVVATTTEADAEAAEIAAEEELQRSREERRAEIERMVAEREAASAERREYFDRRIAERRAAEQAELEAQNAETMKHLEGVSPDAVEAAYEAMRVLAGLDGDYASERNDIGFSQAFTHKGHRLAEMSVGDRTRLADAFAIKIARIFRRQLSASLRARFEKGA